MKVLDDWSISFDGIFFFMHVLMAFLLLLTTTPIYDIVYLKTNIRKSKV
jgi:hypothetical protein